MNKLICSITLVCLLAVVVSGCSREQPTLIKEVPKVFEPDPALFKCTRLTNIPDPQTLTDGEVAELLLVLDENNRVCWRSLQEVQEQIKDAKARLEGE